jgi:hypothetical protein
MHIHRLFPSVTLCECLSLSPSPLPPPPSSSPHISHLPHPPHLSHLSLHLQHLPIYGICDTAEKTIIIFSNFFVPGSFSLKKEFKKSLNIFSHLFKSDCTSWYFSYFLVLFGTSWDFSVLLGTSWDFSVLLGTSWYFLGLLGTSWYFLVLFRTFVLQKYRSLLVPPCANYK